MPRFRQLAAIAAAAGALAFATNVEQAAAQTGARSGLSQSRSGSLRSNYSGGISGARDGISSSYGSSTGGAFAQQQGGRGNGAGGGAGNGATGQSALGGGPMSAGLSQSGSERFQEGGFVGRDAQDVRAGFQSQSGGRGPGGTLDTMIENLNEMRDSRRRWREQNAAPPAIRVQLKPAFDSPAMIPLQANVPLQRRLAKEMATVGVNSPQIEMVGRTAVIRGSVATERDRELIARLASLEPGVSQVENLVQIQPAAASPPSPPRLVPAAE
ncbi:BON domain-containing protein [Lacipirellula sp.]|uniref:BON domain-containing protein n=1 Tax=Lacipirellula sp. TaxID=2691419 RepID=UPI003D13BD1B